MTNWLKSLLLAIAISTSYEVIYYAINKFIAKQDEEQPLDVIFFPDKTVACEAHFSYGCAKKDCWLSHQETSSMRLKRFLLDAELTLEICVYCLASQELIDVVLQVHRKGAVVRVITDGAQAMEHSSVTGKLRAEGMWVSCTLSLSLGPTDCMMVIAPCCRFYRC